jgi:crotonobetainyl-CoA hydratase
LSNSDSPVVTLRHGRVLEIRLHRPPVNAVTRALSQGIYDALKVLQDDPTLSVGLLTAEGTRAFCGGWDLNEMGSEGSGLSETALHSPGGFGGITEFNDLTKPVIAAVHGPAVGGGFEIVLSCDVILMSDVAFFQLPEMLRGFLADTGGVQRLPRRIPYNVAVELLMSGRRFPALEAKQWGLVHEVFPLASFRDQALEYAQQLSKGAPLALMALKAVLRRIERLDTAAAMALTKPGHSNMEIYERMSRSADAIEGARAFLEKRPPVWRGE